MAEMITDYYDEEDGKYYIAWDRNEMVQLEMYQRYSDGITDLISVELYPKVIFTKIQEGIENE